VKIAIFGKTGQLARALRHRIESESLDAVFYNREDCDLSAKTETILNFVKTMPAADIVILAAAYTGVDQAETEHETAFAVNARAPGVIATVCSERNIPLIYISTDYVFNGNSQTPYRPTDHPEPLNVYGQSKAAGEQAIEASGCRALILRTSWIFDGTGRNFMTAILKRAQENKAIEVINDQFGRPTFAEHLAQAVLVAGHQLATTSASRCAFYHVTNTGVPVSWAQFARTILSKTESDFADEIVLNEIQSKDYKSIANRPAYSVLDVTDFERRFEHALPDWKDGLEIALEKWRTSTR